MMEKIEKKPALTNHEKSHEIHIPAKKASDKKIIRQKSVAIPIPVTLIKELKRSFGRGTEYTKALDICQAMLFCHHKRFAPCLEYLPYDGKIKGKITGAKKYYKIWVRMEKLGIIQAKILKNGKRYSIAGNICMHLRISPKLLNGNIEFYDCPKVLKNKELTENGLCKEIENNLNYISVKTSDSKAETTLEKLGEKYILKKFGTSEDTITYEYHDIKTTENIQKQFIRPYLEFEKQNYIQSCRNNLELLRYKHFYVSKAEINNRIHHTLINLPKELLRYIKIKDENLCEIDLSCSQPLLLAYLINEIINNRIPLGCDSKIINIIKSHLPPLLFTSLSKSKSDILTFIEQCQKGELYEYFCYQIYGRYDEELRDVAKNSFIRSLYAKNNFKTEEKANFEKVFPELTQLLKVIKKEFVILFEDHGKNGNYTELDKYTRSNRKGEKTAKTAGLDYLPILLQEIESNIFIETILVELYKLGFVVLPKHDAILCSESDLANVTQIMKEKLNEVLGTGNYKLKTKILNYREIGSQKLDLETGLNLIPRVINIAS